MVVAMRRFFVKLISWIIVVAVLVVAVAYVALVAWGAFDPDSGGVQWACALAFTGFAFAAGWFVRGEVSGNVRADSE